MTSVAPRFIFMASKAQCEKTISYTTLIDRFSFIASGEKIVDNANELSGIFISRGTSTLLEH